MEAGANRLRSYFRILVSKVDDVLRCRPVLEVYVDDLDSYCRAHLSGVKVTAMPNNS